MKETLKAVQRTDANRDPLSGAPGAHPLGTGVGATGGGVAGAAIGAVGGPVGAAIGLAAGAVAGGLAGKAVAEKIDPTVGEEYWRDNYAKRAYIEGNRPYEDYAPAYRTGFEGRYLHAGKTYDDVEDDLRSDYEESGNNKLAWDKAKPAVRDAWNRVEEALPGDFDKDGR